MTSRILSNVILAATITLWFGTASADYDADKLRRVAGGYLDAVQLAAELQQSPCGTYFRKQTAGFAQAIGDLAGYLNPNDINDLLAFLDGKEFRAAQAAKREFIEGWVRSLAKTTGDEQTACTIVSTSVANLYDRTTQGWEQAKVAYGR